MGRQLILVLLLFLLSLTFISAAPETWKYNYLPQGERVQYGGNYSINTNYSETANFWDLLDTPADILHNLLDNLAWSVAGHTIDTDVDFNSNAITNLDHIDWNITENHLPQEGRLSWSSDDGTLSLGMPGGNVNLQIGQEQLIRVKAGEAIGNGEVVYFFGSTGTNPVVHLANASDLSIAEATIGIATEDISSGQHGYITTFGLVRDIDTSSFTENATLYLSGTPGQLTETEPSAPNYTVMVGYVIRSHATEGVIFTRIHQQIWKTELVNDLNTVSSSGVLTGGVLSVGTPTTTYDISDGTGIVVNSTGYRKSVSWSGETGRTPANLATNLLTWVAIDSNGNVLEKTSPFTPSESRANIVLGVIVHTDLATVQTVNNEQVVAYQPLSTAYDIAEALGFINDQGNLYGPSITSPASLKFSKSAGVMFKIGSNYNVDPTNPHYKTLPAVDTASGGIFQYRFNDGTSGPLTDTDIDPDNLDDGAGGLTPVGNNKWSVQRIYSFVSNNVKLQRGVEEFSTKASAIEGITGEAYITEPSIAANGLFRGWLIVQKGATDLSDENQAVWLAASKFGEGSGGGSGAATPPGDAADILLPAKKATAGTINIGQAVRIAGWSGTEITVELADADSATDMPSIGIAREVITDSVVGNIVFSGRLVGENTSTFSIGDTLYVDTTPGALTNTKPTNAGTKIQAVARVLSVDAISGAIQVVGAGRSNDIPYFTAADKMWYGTTNGVSTETNITAFGRSLIDDANSSVALTTLGVATNYVPYTGATSDLDLGTYAYATADVPANTGNDSDDIHIITGNGGAWTTGSSNLGGDSGELHIITGDGGSVSTVASTAGDAGNITIDVGNGGSGGSSYLGGDGGSITIASGNGGSGATAGAAGTLTLTSGGSPASLGNSGNGGDFTMTAGSAGAASQGTGGDGGAFTISGGNGGKQGNFGAAGTGGDLIMTGGLGGEGKMFGGTPGADGNVVINRGKLLVGLSTPFTGGNGSSALQVQGDVSINGTLYTFSPTDENYTPLTRGNELPNPELILDERGHLSHNYLFEKETITDEWTEYPYEIEQCIFNEEGIEQCYTGPDTSRPVYKSQKKTDPFQIFFNNRLMLAELFEVQQIVNTTNYGHIVDFDNGIMTENIWTQSKTVEDNVSYIDKIKDKDQLKNKTTHYAYELIDGYETLNLEERVVALEGAVNEIFTILCDKGILKKEDGCLK